MILCLWVAIAGFLGSLSAAAVQAFPSSMLVTACCTDTASWDHQRLAHANAAQRCGAPCVRCNPGPTPVTVFFLLLLQPSANLGAEIGVSITLAMHKAAPSVAAAQDCGCPAHVGGRTGVAWLPCAPIIPPQPGSGPQRSELAGAAGAVAGSADTAVSHAPACNPAWRQKQADTTRCHPSASIATDPDGVIKQRP